MKHALALVFAALAAAGAQAQATQAPTRVFRCGNTYTNDAAEAQAKGCKPMDGGNFTVIQGTRVLTPPPRAASAPAATPAAAASGSAQAGQRIDSSEQRARDADARAILEGELKKAEARQAELLKEYNNGEPEKLGPETRNYQKYLDRVAELKAAIARNEADIAGIRRELSRLTAAR
ncbi:hypothetical protein EZ242_20760 [Ramlibacter rhizophilus]|uniref:DUF4124 domain-containing protein n=2 Tax=Ramlibacter rhizophilus TaxID=1781167 RepID=A0A4Z0BBP3_9BURK|nr:hypothetical protein [Ramlibacter rhizophilus]TFY96576.1 hypothetical protein EZ242_20760 [Ramlibacter rhizophilus]